MVRATLDQELLETVFVESGEELGLECLVYELFEDDGGTSCDEGNAIMARHGLVEMLMALGRLVLAWPPILVASFEG